MRFAGCIALADRCFGLIETCGLSQTKATVVPFF